MCLLSNWRIFQSLHKSYDNKMQVESGVRATERQIQTISGLFICKPSFADI
jgi:hypothetical protein